MQGRDSGEAEAQHNNGSEGIEEPPWPTPAREHVIETQENEIDMREEGVTGEKRGQSECVERSGNGKLRRREGIKRSLQDITPVSYEEYDNSWDLEDESKKCKRVANFLLASCECRGEGEPIREEEGDLPAILSTGGETRTGRRDRTRTVAQAIPSLGSDHPGQYSDAVAVGNTAQTAESFNHTTDTVNQLYSKPRRVQSSWSKRIFRTMITLMLLITSIWRVEGNSDWRESAFKIQSFDCNTPGMINKLHLPEFCFIPEKSWRRS